LNWGGGFYTVCNVLNSLKNSDFTVVGGPKFYIPAKAVPLCNPLKLLENVIWYVYCNTIKKKEKRWRERNEGN
jgi:hypothetical protein